MKERREKRKRWVRRGRYAVEVEVDVVYPAGDPSEPCLEPATVRWLDEVARRAERGCRLPQVRRRGISGSSYANKMIPIGAEGATSAGGGIGLSGSDLGVRALGVRPRALGPGSPGRSLSQGPHRSGRARQMHPVPHLMTSLRRSAGCGPLAVLVGRNAAPGGESPTRGSRRRGGAARAFSARSFLLPPGTPGDWGSCR